MNKILIFFIYLFIITYGFFTCQIEKRNQSQKRYEKQSDICIKRDNLLKDNIWLSKKILQIIVQSKTRQSNIPFTFRRELSCKQAKKKIIHKWKSLYNSKEDPQIKISNILYYEDYGCKIIVHLTFNRKPKAVK